MNIEPVSEQRNANLFLIGGADSPLVPCSEFTLNQLMFDKEMVYLFD
jgi:hypothetical protein